MSEDERVKLENQCKDWKARKEQLAGLVDKLSAELDGTARPDIAALEAESENVTAGYQQKMNELNEITLKKHEVAENLKRWQELNKERQNIEEKSRNYVALAKDLTGDNAKKISFESWILGVYLEEIAAHASRRRSRISDGRYSLHLKTERSSGHQRYAGLDLEIFDANTGKKRPCDTLSGGETFFVSISLALALTDVVQSRSGGVQLDSLFIDEGFGSLDDTTLEKSAFCAGRNPRKPHDRHNLPCRRAKNENSPPHRSNQNPQRLNSFRHRRVKYRRRGRMKLTIIVKEAFYVE